MIRYLIFNNLCDNGKILQHRQKAMYWQEMSGIKSGIIPEISLSYLFMSQNRYLQDINRVRVQI
jgi:hypothetical protein